MYRSRYKRRVTRRYGKRRSYRGRSRRRSCCKRRGSTRKLIGWRM